MNLQEQNRFRDQLVEAKVAVRRLTERLEQLETRVIQMESAIISGHEEAESVPEKRRPGRPRKIV